MQTQTATLRLAVLPRSSWLTDLVLVAGGAGLVAACAQISFHLGFTPVPITGQTFAVVLVGASLGSIRGTASLLLYLLVGIAGAPVYSQHKHGWEVVSGNVVIYIFGLLWLHHWLGSKGYGNSWNTTLTDGLYPFVPGDMIKLYL